MKQDAKAREIGPEGNTSQQRKHPDSGETRRDAGGSPSVLTRTVGRSVVPLRLETSEVSLTVFQGDSLFHPPLEEGSRTRFPRPGLFVHFLQPMVKIRT